MTTDRSLARRRLASEQFDVVVVGGGVTGAGVALDAAARGRRVALVERADWASGTSSKSSKLVHGGLRYLQQREYRLVAENLRERHRLLRNAPHLVEPLPFLIPLFGSGGVLSAAMVKGYRTALRLYDLAGGWRVGKLHQQIDAATTHAHLPGLDPARLVAGFVYYDAAADDARLTWTLVRSAIDRGAVACNYCEVKDLAKDERGRLCGVLLGDGTLVRARAVVNAAGVWAERLLAMDGQVPYRIRPAKGVHITVPGDKLRADMAAVLPVRGDRRTIFVIPTRELVAPGPGGRPPAGSGNERTLFYIGTTDTDYDGPLDAPECTEDDIRYLLDALNAWLTEPIGREEVLGTWAGLRPLLADSRAGRTADLSRRHRVIRSDSGLVSVLGGKLTTYRKMAEDGVDAVERVLGDGRGGRLQRLRRLLPNASPTRALALHGAPAPRRRPPTLVPSGGRDARLFRRYGTDAAGIIRLIDADVDDAAGLGAPLVPGLPYLRAEALWAVREEQAVTLDDILSRRTRAVLHDRRATLAAAPAVASLVAADLGWDAGERDAQVQVFCAIHEPSTADDAAGSPPTAASDGPADGR